MDKAVRVEIADGIAEVVLAHLPEAREATLDMIRFFDQQMDKR